MHFYAILATPQTHEKNASSSIVRTTLALILEGTRYVGVLEIQACQGYHSVLYLQEVNIEIPGGVISSNLHDPRAGLRLRF